MKKCLICLFLFLSKIGCRNCLVRGFAFQPPKLPTYTLRVMEIPTDVIFIYLILAIIEKS